ncbi:hypothetical protein BN1012_Phect1822 [Candidatus Phaeomarinobacter ectocarpi]|uniref:Uncharacterized protein n=1 Tax=Candidatus Phaeomarinibacter ectocarpi TaxID=1458461 RepID=X5MNE1_9HYPH|nr:hypothetical protein [Candidatus Phaeomarinobacter ectocarpi]CDO60036.1 hypothetical protein BN1012_Phect1822 [Candidatus Phaeomarinobacter ectocarpi]
MTDNTDKQPGKRPSHIAYSVRENQEGKAFFNRVGSAFKHKDGNGFDVALDATPVNGRITLRTPKERLDARRNGESNTQEQDKAREDGDRSS